MNLVIPKNIKKGDTIAFISPSAGLAPFAMHRIEKAKKTLESLGYKVMFSKNALKNAGYVSASPEERADDINAMFADKKVSLIMSTIGGNHSNQLLKHLDFGMIKKNPKIFVGYSDVTVLHHALFTQASLATFYGPAAMTQFGENPTILDYTLEHFLETLSEDKFSKTIKVLPSPKWTDETLDWFSKKDLERARKTKKNTGYKWLVGGKSQGPLVGGAIPSINHLAGTKYLIPPKGKILFLDIPEGYKFDEGMPLSEIDSFLADLENLGFFDEIKGLVIGRLFNSKEEEAFQAVIQNYTKGKGYPVLLNVDLGHTDPMITIRYGGKAFLDSSKNLFSIIH